MMRDGTDIKLVGDLNKQHVLFNAVYILLQIGHT